MTLFFYDSFLIFGDEVSGPLRTSLKISDWPNRSSTSIGKINNVYGPTWSSEVVVGFRRPWNLTSVIYIISKIGGTICFPYVPHFTWFNLKFTKLDCFRIAFGEILDNPLVPVCLKYSCTSKNSNGKSPGRLYSCKSRCSS
jgi:hypothetical protein